MKLIKLVLVCYSLGLFNHLVAQVNIPVATWRTHLSYNHLIDIALAKEQVYSATSNAIFVYDKTDLSIKRITKIDGLSGGEISAIGYSEQKEAFIIGYQDGNIDIIKDNFISSITAIKNDNFTSEKRINSIYTFQDRAYLAGDFGIGIIDLNTLKITETIVNLGPDKINEILIFNDSLFAASSDGVLATSMDPSINILDFNNWLLFENPSTEVISITNSTNQLYAAESQGSIYKYNHGNWVEEPLLQGESFLKLSPIQNGLLILTNNAIWQYIDSKLLPINNTLTSVVNGVIQDETGIVWIADQSNGLIKHSGINDAESIMPSGPFSDNCFQVDFLQNQTLVLSGGISDEDKALDHDEGFYKFDEGRWDNFNYLGKNVIIPKVHDLNSATYNPTTKQFAIASFQEGVLLLNEDHSVDILDQLTTGSTLLSNKISGIAYANDGLWVLNYGQEKSVHHRGDDGLWQSFMLNNSASKYPLDIIVAKNNDKWLKLSTSFGGGLFVFNEKTGKQRLLNNLANNGGLPASNVHSFAEDQDGRIWIGTSRGIAYFSSSQSINDDNTVNAITPRIDFVPVLRDEKITAITIDPGNRKWIGTENGVWLFDENGEKEINHFNVNNSPLLSNSILSIGINPINGEVFFATNKGLISYRGTATLATETHQSVKIFPNPITKNFNGLVAIAGLANNAIVKITDVSGKLIRQMQANGGTATWNVADYNGNRAVTGVYLVFSATEDGEDSFVGKMAVIN